MATAVSTTPLERPPSSSHQRSNSQSRNIPSRPTTPLRPPSRTSLRASQTTPSGILGASTGAAGELPLAALEPGFAELSDSMADLEANFMHLQLLNESLGRFNECFGSFLYGMNMGAFCVDFPEAPIPQSFARHKDTPSNLHDSPFRSHNNPNTPGGGDIEATFLTTDTSFVENPPTSVKASKFSAPGAARGSRQTMAPSRGATGTRGAATSGIARNTSTRGGSAAGAARGGGGLGRGSGTRGRGGVR